MSEPFVTHGQLELIHPDGHTMTEGPAEVRAGPERIEVFPERGREFLIDYVTLGELELVGDAVPLVLDSGYTVRLSRLAEPEELLRHALAGRSAQLVSRLRLPGRASTLELPGELTWSERGWAPQSDGSDLVLCETHLILIPHRHRPMAFPVGGLTEVAARGGAVSIACEHLDLRAVVEPSGASPEEVAGQLLSARARAVDTLRNALPEPDRGLAERLAGGGTVGEAPGEAEAFASLLEALPCDERQAPFELLRGLTREGELRIGVSVCPSEARDGELRAVSWALAPCVGRGRTDGIAVAMVLSEPAACAVAFRMPPRDEQERTDVSFATFAAACDLSAPEFEPLGLRETEMSEYSRGEWLWPMHHFETLRAARRRVRCLLPHADPGEWSQELLQLVALS